MPQQDSISQSKREGNAKPMGNLLTCLVIGSGGFVGANTRYFIGRWAVQKWGTSFPFGTLIINVSGCFILGLFAVMAARLAWNEQWRLFIAVGFLGAFTTFSTFEYETFDLTRQGEMIRAGLNICGSVIIGFIAVALGASLAQLFLRGNN